MPKTAVFYLDARVLGLPAVTDVRVSDLDDLLLRIRAIYPLEVIIITSPLMDGTVRRRIGMLSVTDIVGAATHSPTATAGAVTRDSHVRKARGAASGWLLALDAPAERLRAAVVPVRLLAVGLRVDPPSIEDIEEPLLTPARRKI
ncbi:hypothetical protein QBL02_06325 [Leucobacter sp. UT-8R-CII-1-4]|uniref:hypothetical protein n=1 Tax=Leucobacter sp. UT-8R-CII-1-4 TaxID=3040075 RepID=UPI0024A90303|nr:hypothetical protein [Leucobacter sp. UT-8R-CII-1-4]MDI6023158.1 hypothetical protein [Leucobacter sp. UT-8R-CII-1-4]